MKSILFVCLGNICRSPIAEGYAQSIVASKGLEIRVDSAVPNPYYFHDFEGFEKVYTMISTCIDSLLEDSI